MGKVTTLHWGVYTRNQEAVAQAIARKEYMDMTPTGVEVVDELLALMDQAGIMHRLAVEGEYQRRMVPMLLQIVTYSSKIILGLSSQHQIPPHLFRDAGLLRRIGYTAKQIEEGFYKRGKGEHHPLHKNTLAAALERLTVEESQAIFAGAVEDLVKARLFDDTVFSLDGTELSVTEHYPGAGRVTSTRAVKDKWGNVKTSTSTRYGYLLLSLRGVKSNTVVAAGIDNIGACEHAWVPVLVQKAKSAGVKIKTLLADGAYCVGDMLWQLKHKENIDFIVPADNSMCITEDARSLAQMKEGVTTQKDPQITAMGIKNLTTYEAYTPRRP